MIICNFFRKNTPNKIKLFVSYLRVIYLRGRSLTDDGVEDMKFIFYAFKDTYDAIGVFCGYEGT